jgi:hypothetical protein
VNLIVHHRLGEDGIVIDVLSIDHRGVDAFLLYLPDLGGRGGLGTEALDLGDFFHL